MRHPSAPLAGAGDTTDIPREIDRLAARGGVSILVLAPPFALRSRCWRKDSCQKQSNELLFHATSQKAWRCDKHFFPVEGSKKNWKDSMLFPTFLNL